VKSIRNSVNAPACPVARVSLLLNKSGGKIHYLKTISVSSDETEIAALYRRGKKMGVATARERGFSKDGKHSQPEVELGLPVSAGGYPRQQSIFEIIVVIAGENIQILYHQNISLNLFLCVTNLYLLNNHDLV
jgi:hypothetical protein